MDDFLQDWIVKFEFKKLMKADAPDQEVEIDQKLKLSILYPETQNETYYEIECGAKEKKLIDISKMMGNSPMMRLNYEWKDSEFLEAVIT